MDRITAFFTNERVETPLLRRAMLYLEDGEWQNADEACERVLDAEPENPYAYVIKLMAQLHVHNEQELCAYSEPIELDRWFQKAVKFADPELRECLNGIAGGITERLEQQRQEAERQRLEQEQIERRNSYQKAMKLMALNATISSLEEARGLLRKSCGYQDAQEQIKICEQRIRQLREEAQADELARQKRKSIMVFISAVIVAVLAYMYFQSVTTQNAKTAADIENRLGGRTFTAKYSDAEFPEGSFVARRYEETEETISFTGDHTVCIKKKVSVDHDGSLITINGVKQFDSVTTTEEVYTTSEVSVSFSGKATIRINGYTYEILLGSNDRPIGLKRGNVEYR